MSVYCALLNIIEKWLGFIVFPDLIAATENTMKERGSKSWLTVGIISPEPFKIIKEMKTSYPMVEKGDGLAFFAGTLKHFFSTAVDSGWFFWVSLVLISYPCGRWKPCHWILRSWVLLVQTEWNTLLMSDDGDSPLPWIPLSCHFKTGESFSSNNFVSILWCM